MFVRAAERASFSGVSSTFAPAARAIRRFLRWWFAELAGLVPAGLRRSPRWRPGTLVVVVEEKAALLLRAARGRHSVLAEVAASGPAGSASDLVGRLLERPDVIGHLRARGAAKRVRLRIARREALHTKVNLPLAAEENLEEVLRFELDRWTPFRPGDVYLNHRIEERAAELVVRLTVVPRRIVDGAVAALSKLGIAVAAIEVARDDQADVPPDLLLHREPKPARSRARALSRLAAAAMLATGIAAAVPSVLQAAREGEALTRELADGRRLLAEAQRLKDEIARLEKEEEALSARGSRVVSPIELLYQLTRLLPDDTWLVRLRVASDKIMLSCYSASSARVIRLLQDSPHFQSPSFSSPVVQEKLTGREQFEITAQLAGRTK